MSSGSPLKMAESDGCLNLKQLPPYVAQQEEEVDVLVSVFDLIPDKVAAQLIGLHTQRKIHAALGDLREHILYDVEAEEALVPEAETTTFYADEPRQNIKLLRDMINEAVKFTEVLEQVYGELLSCIYGNEHPSCISTRCAVFHCKTPKCPNVQAVLAKLKRNKQAYAKAEFITAYLSGLENTYLLDEQRTELSTVEEPLRAVESLRNLLPTLETQKREISTKLVLYVIAAAKTLNIILEESTNFDYDFNVWWRFFFGVNSSSALKH
ncbi:MAG: hypothetical protein KAI86_09150 [Desulfobacterales bacterium]|nr:hypothetical protein [Desulfobacterales bacterium]